MAKKQIAPKPRMISRQELVRILGSINKPTPMSVVMRTVPKMNVKSRLDGAPNPFLNDLVKFTRCLVMIGASYENMVNNRLEKTGQGREFVSASHSWAEQVEGTRCLYAHRQTGELHLGYVPQRTLETEYRTLSDDRRVGSNELESYLPPVKSGAERQGLSEDDCVKFRTVKLSNIAAVVWNHELLMVMNEPGAPA